MSAVTSSGLHSTVISASSVTGIALSTSANSSGSTSVGVPPPTNTLLAGGSLARSSAIDRNRAGAAFGANGVSGEALAIGHVVDVDLLVFLDVGCLKQIFIDGAGTLVVQFGVGNGDPVQL
jgi:hypothetical protein